MFEDRKSAGFLLAKRLEKFANRKDILVLGLARGGVEVAKIVSIFLGSPLEALVVKKISAPSNPELAIGAVAPGGAVYWNKEVIQRLGIKPSIAERLRKGKENERKMQERIIRGGKPLEISGKRVILVDDGVATGASVIAAAYFLKKEKASKIILAVPVIAKDTYRDIKKYFDLLIVLKKKEEFYAVGQFYKDFPQVTNEEVKSLLV